MRPAGLEPAAYWFEASRSIQLSYGRTQGEDHITQALEHRAFPRVPRIRMTQTRPIHVYR
jgi:hypothetical protein